MPAARSVVVSPLGVLGWWEGAGWVQWRPGIEVPLRGGEQYVTLTISTKGPAVGTVPQPATGEGCGVGAELPPVVRLTGEDGAVDNHPIGVTGPRVDVSAGRELPTTSAEYRALAGEALRSIGVDAPEPRLAQVVRANLRGDGSDEVLLVAERVSPGAGAVGDYSVLILRELVGDKVQTQVLHQSMATGADEAGEARVSVARVAAFVDINGDKSVEVVVTYQLGESVATSVIDMSEPRARKVLSAGCPN